MIYDSLSTIDECLPIKSWKTLHRLGFQRAVIPSQDVWARNEFAVGLGYEFLKNKFLIKR
jgi:hypothetical protein